MVGYTPSRTSTAVFTAFFSISTALHLGQFIYKRSWFLLPTVILCGVAEVVGWAARLMQSMDPTDPGRVNFKIQTILLLLAPTPLLAANFMVFGKLVRELGTSYSRLTPRWYGLIFGGCDILSLFIQGIGGGMLASGPKNPKKLTEATNIMLGGIIFQLISIIVYVALATEYWLRYRSDSPVRSTNATEESLKDGRARGEMTNRRRLMFYGLAINLVFLFIRAIYRCVELFDGFGGRIMSTEVYFDVLDGAMILLAMFSLNLFHPGWLLGETRKEAPVENKEFSASSSTVF
ncbi:RTA1 like protein [Coprinopsis marcescibilis]|uniref:RTA1 like protein n=1 Tax=Coprinopsis marcescibilis TaxID=230819 RepID=A0A5C3L1P9_COPMA|nr:RTA1 like protein [Coprinopsis marcescibilis]